MVTHDDIPEAGLKILRQSCDLIILQNYSRAEILDKSKGVHGIFWATLEKLNAEVLDAAGAQLKSISTLSAGIDHVDVAELKRCREPEPKISFPRARAASPSRGFSRARAASPSFRLAEQAPTLETSIGCCCSIVSEYQNCVILSREFLLCITAVLDFTPHL